MTQFSQLFNLLNFRDFFNLMQKLLRVQNQDKLRISIILKNLVNSDAYKIW